MANILNKPVLLINADWRAIGTIPVKKAMEDMNSSKHPKLAIKLEYVVDDKGNPDYESPTEIIPLAWREWITLSPRSYDEDSIHTVNMEIRIPTVVIVGSKYRKMPVKTFRATKKNIFDHYKGICAYSGKQLSYKSMTLDHIQPRSRKGGNTWSNLVPCDGEINRLKADKTPEEAGLKLKYQPSEPKPVPAEILIKSVIEKDWLHFLKFDKF